MQLSPATQESLVSLLCYDQEAAPVAASVVPTRFFDPIYQEIAEAANRYRSKFGKVPGEHTLDLIHNLKGKFPKNAEPYERVFQSLEAGREGINSEYVIQQATLFTRFQKIKRGLSKAIGILEREDEAALLEGEGILRAALDSSVQLFDPGTLIQDSARSLRFLDHREDQTFLTGIKCLDKAELGPLRKGLHLFIAPKKAGKSWWLINLAKRALLDRKRVVYITLEMSEELVAQRMLQAFFAVSKRRENFDLIRFEHDELGRFTGFTPEVLVDRPAFTDTKIREKLRKLIDERLKQRPPLLIKQFPTGMLTVEELQGYLSLLEAKGVLPDLLILDYADLMHLPVNDYRLQLGALYRTLRGIAVQRNIAIATASQSNRAGGTAKLVTGEHAAEDYSKLATCDVCFTYNQTQAERELGLARIFVAAARGDRDKFTVLISQAYAIGQFVCDEAGYVSSYWENLNAEPERRDDGEDHSPSLRLDEGSRVHRGKQPRKQHHHPEGKARRVRHDESSS